MADNPPVGGQVLRWADNPPVGGQGGGINVSGGEK